MASNDTNTQDRNTRNPDTQSHDAAEPLRLRRTGVADAEALALVGAATFLEAFTWMLPGADIIAHTAKHHTPEAWLAYLSKPATFVTLAEVLGGAPVGYSMLAAPELPTFDVQPSDVELKRIYLFSRFRTAAVQDERGETMPGMRPGQALMDAALLAGRRMGRSRVLLGTHQGNDRAIGFYRRNGFAEAGTRTFQVGSKVCCDLIFARVL